VFFCIYQH